MSRESIPRALAFTTEAALKRMEADKSQPYALRLIARALLADDGFRALGSILDRIAGKVFDVGGEAQRQEPMQIRIIDTRGENEHGR